MSGPASAIDWRPSASIETLRARAEALARVRAFFAQRNVLEVDTPALVNFAVTDVNLHVASVQVPGYSRSLHLHTSPEYGMKRLLASGSGDIYQMSHVFRGDERGRLHNPEFMLVEWYRRDWSMDALMREVAELVGTIWQRPEVALDVEMLSWQDAFRRELGLDPLEAPRATIEDHARELGLAEAHVTTSSLDELLDLIMGTRIGPALGRGRLTFVHRYPASQAALARLDATDPRVALRFELYAEGIELANGFDELADSTEQRARFTADADERRRRGLPAPVADEWLLQALSAGLPACSGVALGFDRALMIGLGARRLDEVIPFAVEHA